MRLKAENLTQVFALTTILMAFRGVGSLSDRVDRCDTIRSLPESPEFQTISNPSASPDFIPWENCNGTDRAFTWARIKSKQGERTACTLVVSWIDNPGRKQSTRLATIRRIVSSSGISFRRLVSTKRFARASDELL